MIDGKTDIMYTGIASGNKTGSATPMAFTFNHQLSWLSFQIQAAAGTGSEIAAIWGNVTSISILNLATTLTLNLPATPAFSGTGTINTFSASDSAPAALAIPANGSPAFFSQAMVQPQAYNSGISGNYQIQVVTTNGGTMTTPITITSNGTTVAGQKHLITLTFTESAITSTSTITAWTNGAAGSGSL